MSLIFKAICEDCGEYIITCSEKLENTSMCPSANCAYCGKPANVKVFNILKYKENMTEEGVVNHPKHYTSGKHECFDELLAMFGKDAVIDFCKCNIYKYRYRSNLKNGEEDLQKADWYMDRLVELTV